MGSPDGPKTGSTFSAPGGFFPRILTGSGVLAMGQLLGKVVPRHEKGGLRARDCGTPPASNACGMDKISPWIVIELHALHASPRLSLQCGCTSLDCQRSFPFSAHVPLVCDMCPHRRVLDADTCYMLGRKRHAKNTLRHTLSALLLKPPDTRSLRFEEHSEYVTRGRRRKHSCMSTPTRLARA